MVCVGSVGAGTGVPESETLSEQLGKEYGVFGDMSYMMSVRTLNKTRGFEISEEEVSPDGKKTSRLIEQGAMLRVENLSRRDTQRTSKWRSKTLQNIYSVNI